uniref:MULE transposase N-terminal all-beta domain-containing protein n=1 Tax=Brassica oleracea var. oleracea TaxID=109376 RepID=A0A0D3CHL9_BRAOL
MCNKTMGYSFTSIHFDYDRHYLNSGDDYEWIPRDVRLYAISFKTSSLEEITYSLLKERICMKMTIDLRTKRLNMSYIPLLTSVDKEERKSILHVEDIKELEIVPITEQQSRAEKESSYGGNYSELASGLPNVEVINMYGRTRVRTPGIPSKCWCGDGIIELISKSNQNPYHRYYQCLHAAQRKLKYQVRMLDEEVQVLKEKIRSEGPKNRKIMILGGYLIPIIAVALGIWMYE